MFTCTNALPTCTAKRRICGIGAHNEDWILPRFKRPRLTTGTRTETKVEQDKKSPIREETCNEGVDVCENAASASASEVQVDAKVGGQLEDTLVPGVAIGGLQTPADTQNILIQRYMALPAVRDLDWRTDRRKRPVHRSRLDEFTLLASYIQTRGTVVEKGKICLGCMHRQGPWQSCVVGSLSEGPEVGPEEAGKRRRACANCWTQPGRRWTCGINVDAETDAANLAMVSVEMPEDGFFVLEVGPTQRVYISGVETRVHPLRQLRELEEEGMEQIVAIWAALGELTGGGELCLG
ncbi:DUF3716 domain-containing protein [Aspergillus mulundensis]|uniref:Uncharacterized protein n=1 Tax=Aspergillus mulundensis TaxID=1810919 RepID=A0A3D8RYT6_9EURO|nr:hypothetical protein DSM5745_06065 [Aspergillus mulundensis]RDW79213.1 hypothetical protein DSM5745_06065 [Aspergillus mulundensis]